MKNKTISIFCFLYTFLFIFPLFLEAKTIKVWMRWTPNSDLSQIKEVSKADLLIIPDNPSIYHQYSSLIKNLKSLNPNIKVLISKDPLYINSDATSGYEKEVWEKYRGNPLDPSFNPSCYLLKSRNKHSKDKINEDYYCWPFVNYMAKKLEPTYPWPYGGWGLASDKRVVTDPRSNWKYYFSQMCETTVLKTGADGIFLENFHPKICWAGYEVDLNGNNSVDEAGDDNIWNSAMITMAGLVQDAIEHVNPSAITIYMNSPTTLPDNNILNQLKGIECGSYFAYKGSGAQIIFSSGADWQSQVNAIINVGTKLCLCGDIYSGSGLLYDFSLSILSQIRLYALSSYLLCRQNNSYYSIFPAYSYPLLLPEQEIDIGEPSSSYKPIGDCYYRDYSSGKVIVNPNNISSQTVNCGGPWYKLNINAYPLGYKGGYIEERIVSGNISVGATSGVILSSSSFYPHTIFYGLMEEGSGNIINACSNTSLAGSLEGNISRVDGGVPQEKGAQCLLSEGGRINFGDNFDFNSCSLQVWFKPSHTIDENNPTNIVLMEKSNQISIGWDISDKGKIKFKIRNGGVWYSLVSQHSIWIENKWYHLSSTWGPNGMQLYVNGKLESSSSFTGGPDSGTDNFYLGSNSFQGYLDNFRVSDTQTCSVEPVINPEETKIFLFTGSGYNTIKWQMTTSKIIKGFYIYRSQENGPYKRISSLLNPATSSYIDPDIKEGVFYSYILAVIDSHELESFLNPVSDIARTKEIELYQNYPNPFTNSTRIKYVLSLNAKVRLEIYNLNGELVKVLKNEEQPPNTYYIDWDCKDETGKEVCSGVYLCILQVGNSIEKKKLILLR